MKGAPNPPELLVELCSADALRYQNNAAITDTHGAATLGPLRPLAYWLCVRPLDRSWFHVVPRPVNIVPGEVAQLDVDVTRHPGTLVVRDERGPRASTPLLLMTAAKVTCHFEREVRTNAQGEIELELTAGAWRLRNPRPERTSAVDHTEAELEPHADFEWTNDAAQTPAVVLPRR